MAWNESIRREEAKITVSTPFTGTSPFRAMWLEAIRMSEKKFDAAEQRAKVTYEDYDLMGLRAVLHLSPPRATVNDIYRALLTTLGDLDVWKSMYVTLAKMISGHEDAVSFEETVARLEKLHDERKARVPNGRGPQRV